MSIAMVKWSVWIAVAIAVAAAIWMATDRGVGRSESLYTYGFEGPVFHAGDLKHAIHYDEGVAAEDLSRLAEYLMRIGYFSSEYSGIIQVLKGSGGYEVDLTYALRFWDRLEFADELANIGSDLQELVLRRPVRVVAVDEDETRIYRKTFFDGWARSPSQGR